jgi:hypothetical protein
MPLDSLVVPVMRLDELVGVDQFTRFYPKAV